MKQYFIIDQTEGYKPSVEFGPLDCDMYRAHEILADLRKKHKSRAFGMVVTVTESEAINA